MSAAKRKNLLASIAVTIGDYREGEIGKLNSAHVDKWIGQFDADVQEPLLAEIDAVLNNTYINRAAVESFLGTVLHFTELAGTNVCHLHSAHRDPDLARFRGGPSASAASRSEVLGLTDSQEA